jgi:hypothetical protein
MADMTVCFDDSAIQLLARRPEALAAGPRRGQAGERDKAPGSCIAGHLRAQRVSHDGVS